MTGHSPGAHETRENTANYYKTTNVVTVMSVIRVTPSLAAGSVNVNELLNIVASGVGHMVIKTLYFNVGSGEDDGTANAPNGELTDDSM